MSVKSMIRFGTGCVLCLAIVGLLDAATICQRNIRDRRQEMILRELIQLLLFGDLDSKVFAAGEGTIAMLRSDGLATYVQAPRATTEDNLPASGEVSVTGEDE